MYTCAKSPTTRWSVKSFSNSFLLFFHLLRETDWWKLRLLIRLYDGIIIHSNKGHGLTMYQLIVYITSFCYTRTKLNWPCTNSLKSVIVIDRSVAREVRQVILMGRPKDKNVAVFLGFYPMRIIYDGFARNALSFSGNFIDSSLMN